MRTALLMPTVRAHAVRVAELFLHDARAHGARLGDISLYFSIDPPLTRQELRIDPGLRAELGAVRCIDGDRRAELAWRLAATCALDPRLLSRALVERGYGSARNAALVQALADGNDAAVFVDDDVYPLAPREGAGGAPLAWHGTDFLRTHLAQLGAGADITRGGYLGYSAPLVDLTGVLPGECLTALGLALSLGNEVLPPDCLSDPPAAAVLAGPGRPAAEPGAVAKGLVVYGGNVGISLAAMADGRVPAFLSPPGARGEDTFFGLQLPGAARVEPSTALVFHDPFRLCAGLLHGEAPAQLARAAEPTAEHLRRFGNAVRGWVRYAPLWVRTQYDDPVAGRKTVRAIASIYARHPGCLATLGLGDVPELFRLAAAAAESELAFLHELDDAWRTTMVPAVRGAGIGYEA
jgi:hypothetical protein